MLESSSDSDISMDYEQEQRTDYRDLCIDIDEVNRDLSQDNTSICGCNCGVFNMYENEKSCEKCNGDNFEDHNPVYSISSQKGRKRTQEDRFLVDQKFMGEGNQAVFAIFDGHSGSRASQYCKDTLVSKLTGNYEQLHENTSSTIQEVLKEIDFEFLDLAQKQNLEGGSTCVLGMIMNTKLTVANIGDSSAFLVKNSNVIELTSDHNYSRLDEYSRVTSQNLGEFLILKNRLNGQLALSRSIGDLKYRPAVTSEAETQTITLSSLDQYLILTSDGVWSKKFSKRDAINYINTCIKFGRSKEDISQGIIDEAIRSGSQDNITVVIVDLSHYYSSSVCSSFSPNTTTRSLPAKDSQVMLLDMDQRTSGRKSYNFCKEEVSPLHDLIVDRKAPSSFSEKIGSAVSGWGIRNKSFCNSFTIVNSNSGTGEGQLHSSVFGASPTQTMSIAGCDVARGRKSLSLKEQESYYRQCQLSKKNKEKRTFGF